MKKASKKTASAPQKKNAQPKIKSATVKNKAIAENDNESGDRPEHKPTNG